MVNRNVIAEYEDACRLVEETESDLISLKKLYEGAAVDVVRGSNPNFPYEPRTFRIEGVDYAEYKNPTEIHQLEVILGERKERAKEKRMAVEYWMNTVPSRIARIVRMKYFMKKSWSDVAFAVGLNTPEAARMELTRFMKGQDIQKEL